MASLIMTAAQLRALQEQQAQQLLAANAGGSAAGMADKGSGVPIVNEVQPNPTLGLDNPTAVPQPAAPIVTSPTPVLTPKPIVGSPTPVPAGTTTPKPIVSNPSPVTLQPVPGTGGATPATTAPADASVATQLTGLLNSNSPYMAAARKGGIRTAARRGLLNSSIAAGSAEAAAIAAGAPIASQDAAQIHSRNQTNLEADLNLRNSSAVQSQQDAAAMARQLAAQEQQRALQTQDLEAQLQRLGITVAAEKDLANTNNASALTREQISQNSSLINNYLSAFGSMAQNAELPAEARNAYIAEMKAVIQQGMGLTAALSGVTLNWAAPVGSSTSAGGLTGTTNLPSQYSGPSKEQIMAMVGNHIDGDYEAASAAWNKAHPNDQLPPYDQVKKAGGFDKLAKSGMLGVAGLLS